MEDLRTECEERLIRRPELRTLRLRLLLEGLEARRPYISNELQSCLRRTMVCDCIGPMMDGPEWAVRVLRTSSPRMLLHVVVYSLAAVVFLPGPLIGLLALPAVFLIFLALCVFVANSWCQ